MDAQGEFQEIPYKKLDKLISNVGYDKMLVISNGHSTLYSLVEGNEFNVHSIHEGETEHVIRTRASVAIRKGAYKTSIDDLANMHDRHHWKGVPVDSTYQESAYAMSFESTADHNRQVECFNCRGRSAPESIRCSCTYGGIVFDDEESRATESLRQEGVPDSQCGRCAGTGVYEHVCTSCNGQGVSYLYPLLTLTNRSTGESVTEVLDVASLVASGKLPLLNEGNGHAIIAKFSMLHKQMALSVGVDPSRFAGESQYGVFELDDPRSEVYIYPQARRRHKRASEEDWIETPEDVIHAIQRNIARTYIHVLPESILDSANVVRGRSLSVFELPSVVVELKELVRLVESNGWRLAYTRGFVETEVDGPSFIIVTEDMKMIAELATEQNFAMAVTSALHFLKAQLG